MVYCTPCLLLLALGLAHRDKDKLWLRKILDRFSRGTIQRFVPIAIALFVLEAATLTIALWP